jgi:hypothetical protein
MKSKLILILAALALTFVSADATTKTPRSTIKVMFIEQPNGDYRLFLFGSDRALVCEEKDIKIVEQGDAVNPVVLSCDHSK